ncbi:MAG: MmgE/PrpD family protein [candidate division NC10 bacterium]|nr:MmgE/PrpD family protein [candidate division NC10 bacterium]MBI2115593.1 MmgE/PrpD family protein [candidate division NC10 bacterium]MBI2561049.1 MmgE/PrpD family protein [candidate division NC10 bacterium]
MATISEQMAAFIFDTDSDALSADALTMAKLCVLDWLGSVYAGKGSRPAVAILLVAKSLGGNPEATLLPDGSQSSAYMAALVNAAASHVVEMDDLHKGSILHPAAPVIPAALAMAEREGTSGRELLASIVLGYEVAIRVGEAMGPSHYQFWHTTGTCGTFGAAAAVGRILGLSKQELAAALGSAGTQAAGLWEFLVDGAMSKQLHPAKAAADGLLAALLAEQGFTAASRIFEGDKGFCRAMAKEPDLGRLTQGLGTTPLRILSTSFKAHAACYHIHSAIDAVLEIRRKHSLQATEVKKVHIALYPAALDLLEKVEPQDPYAAKFNIPFCVATALVYGQVAISAFTTDRLHDPKIRGVMERISLARDPELGKAYPERWPAVAEITTRAGETHVARIDFPRGDPKNPMTQEELVAKFHNLATPALNQEQRKKTVDACLQLEQVENLAGFFADLA